MLLIKAYKKLLKKTLGLDIDCLDSEMVIKIIKKNLATASEMETIIKNTKFTRDELITLSILDRSFFVKFVPNRYKSSKSFVLEFFKRNMEENDISPMIYLDKIPEELKSDLKFLKEIVKIDGYAISHDCIINTKFYNSDELSKAANEYFINHENMILYFVEAIEINCTSIYKIIQDLRNSYNFAKSQGVTYFEDYEQQYDVYRKELNRELKILNILRNLEAYKIQSKKC